MFSSILLVIELKCSRNRQFSKFPSTTPDAYQETLHQHPPNPCWCQRPRRGAASRRPATGKTNPTSAVWGDGTVRARAPSGEKELASASFCTSFFASNLHFVGTRSHHLSFETRYTSQATRKLPPGWNAEPLSLRHVETTFVAFCRWGNG